MPEYKIVGFSRFTSKKNSKEYFHIYYTYTQKGTEGFVCDDLFVAPELISGGAVTLGATFQAYYDKRGFIQALEINS